MSTKVKYTSFVSNVMKQVYKEDRKVKKQAALHIKKKVKAKINKLGVSIAGQPPSKVSGNLVKGLKIANKKTIALVGFVAPAFHAHLLEFGTEVMAPRPFFFDTLAEESNTVKKIMSDYNV